MKKILAILGIALVGSSAFASLSVVGNKRGNSGTSTTITGAQAGDMAVFVWVSGSYSSPDESLISLTSTGTLGTTGLNQVINVGGSRSLGIKYVPVTSAGDVTANYAIGSTPWNFFLVRDSGGLEVYALDTPQAINGANTGNVNHYDFGQTCSGMWIEGNGSSQAGWTPAVSDYYWDGWNGGARSFAYGSFTDVSTYDSTWSSATAGTGTTVGLALSTTPPYVPPNIITDNPGFETGTTEGWDGFGCSISVVSTTPHDGTYCGVGTARQGTWAGPKYDLMDKMYEGRTYNISAWVRTSSASSVPVKIQMKKDGAGAAIVSGTASDGWVQLSAEYTLSSTPTELYVYFTGPDGAVDVYVDDLYIYDVDGPYTPPTTDGYDTWLSPFSSGMGALTNMTDDADGDLLTNLGEYAFGGNPTNGADRGNFPVNSQVADGGTNYLQYIYFERDDAATRGLTSTLEVGAALGGTWTTSGIESVGSGASGVAGFNAVTNRIPATDPQEFLKLKIEFTP